MKLEYNSVYDIAEFPDIKLEKKHSKFLGSDYFVPSKDCEPYIKEEYRDKTLYCVFELKNDYYSEAECGFMTKENTWYNRGYYVIPCYLTAHRYANGNKVVLHYRKFCYTFGEPREYEPQDVPKDKWKIASNFKKYWGLVQTSLHYFAYSEDVELYTDVCEAIKRAKELDKLMELTEKYNKVSNSLDSAINLNDKLRSRIASELQPINRKKTLERELAQMTYDKRTKRIKTLLKQNDKLKTEVSKYIPYNAKCRK